MADVSQLIGQGIGFSPGSVEFIVRDGLSENVQVAGATRADRKHFGSTQVVTPGTEVQLVSSKGAVCDG